MRLVKTTWNSVFNNVPLAKSYNVDESEKVQGLFRCWNQDGRILTHKYFVDDMVEGVGEYYDIDKYLLERIDTNKKDIDHGVEVFMFYDNE